jgi:hypothetical protein
MNNLVNKKPAVVCFLLGNSLASGSKKKKPAFGKSTVKLKTMPELATVH